MENAAVTQAAAPVIYQGAMGLPQNDFVTMPVDPIQAIPSYDLALSSFEAQPSVRVLFDNGAGRSPYGDKTAGNPYPGFEHSFPKVPVPRPGREGLYSGPEGGLTDRRPTGKGVNWYTSDA